MNRRGMSAVVTTLIIILLVIVSIGIVWVVIKNILSKGSDEISLTGLTLDLEILKASVDDTNLNVTVKRNAGEGNLVGINFVISDGDNAVVVERETDMEELETQTFSFVLSTLAVNNITSIEVAPIYETSSGKEIVGSSTDVTNYDAGDMGTGGGSGAGEGGSCVPTVNCTGLECGNLNNGCGTILDCGTCEGTDICGADNICYPNNCTPDPDPCATLQCGEVNDGCGTMVDCELEYGNCSSQYGESWECVNNYCVEKTYSEAGLIDNVWPPGTGIYFDSDELTKQDSLYYGYSAAFSSDTGNCYLIVGYSYDSLVYPNAIVEIFLEEPLEISIGDTYEIWENINDCTNALPVL